MKTILAFLATASLALAATGDYLFQKKTSTGYDPVLITPAAGQVIAWSGGAPINLDIAATYQPIIATGGLALNKLAQGGATSGQALSWNGSAWAPATVFSNLTSGPVTSSGGVSAIADNAISGAKISSIPPTVQTALDAKRSREASTYENFGRLPDGAISGSPQKGAAWRWNTDSAVAPHVVGGALVGNPSGELFYIGNRVMEGINSIQFDIETGPGTGASYALPILSLAGAQMLDTDGNGLTLPPHQIHIELGTNGFLNIGYAEAGQAAYEKMSLTGVPYPTAGVYPYSENQFSEIAVGTRATLTLTVSGGDLIMNFLGRRFTTRHPFASNSLVFTGQPSDGDTFATGGVTYTMRNTLAGVANTIKIGASLAVTINNITNALNQVSEAANTTFGAGTVANPQVAGAGVLGTTVILYARKGGPVGNAITVSESLSNATIAKAGGTLTGGERTPFIAMGTVTDWYYEASNSPTSVRQTSKLHSVSINDPSVLQSPSSVIAKLSTAGIAPFGMGQFVNEKIKAGLAATVLAESNYPANTKIISTGSIGTEGNFVQNVSGNGKNHRYALLDGKGITSPITSTSTAGLGTFASLMSPFGGYVSTYDADDWGYEEHIIYGYFPNTNSKILQVVSTFAGELNSVLFQSETITASGLFELTLTTHNKATAPRLMLLSKLEYITGGTTTTPVSGVSTGTHFRTIGGTVTQERSIGRLNYAAPLNLRAATTGAGDVVIQSVVTRSSIRP